MIRIDKILWLIAFWVVALTILTFVSMAVDNGLGMKAGRVVSVWGTISLAFATLWLVRRNKVKA